jgi:hypothetical protein
MGCTVCVCGVSCGVFVGMFRGAVWSRGEGAGEGCVRSDRRECEREGVRGLYIVCRRMWIGISQQRQWV